MSEIFDSIIVSEEVKKEVDEQFNKSMETTFKLGPLQTLWLQQLRKYPERQTIYILGKGTPKSYKACCLGEIHLCAARLAKKKLPFVNGEIYDGDDQTLNNSFNKYGLKDRTGHCIKNEFNTSKGMFSQLSGANDEGVTWTEIADIIEKDPTNFFTKSV